MEYVSILKHAAVIGGVNADICGHSFQKLMLHDSNIGAVSVKAGGVGRNIAHNLALLGVETSLVTVFGTDVYAPFLRKSCEEVGVDLSLSLTIPDEISSTYLYVTDESGDMCVAVNDMTITSHLDSAFLLSIMDKLNTFDAVVVDANLSAAAIETLASHCTAPLYADPVSCAKAHRFDTVLPRLRMLKPNIYEAQELTGLSSAYDAADQLLSKGVERVFISLGSRGMLGAEGSKRYERACEHIDVVNATGAGDSVTAALVYADLMGLSIEDSTAIAMRAGMLTCLSDTTNSPRLSELRLKNEQ